MVSDLKNCKFGEHASNLGAIIAFDLSKEYNIPAFIADPVTVDEMTEIAKFTGLKGLERKSIFHALNQKYVARKFSREFGKKYEDLNLVVVHMGGGISIGTHSNGKVVDVNNALNGDGPYSPERAGTLPTLSLAEVCFSNKYTKAQMLKNLAGKGGFVSHLGTNDALEVENRALNGDTEAKLILDGMIYQIAKGIGEAITVLKGKIDAIILTGGIAKSNYIVEEIKSYVSFIAQIFVYPGENEMEALAENVFRVIRGETEPCTYE
jgi:butyrate kinase